MDIGESGGTVLGIMFLIIPITLTIFIILLLVRLKQKEKVNEKLGVPNLFVKETKNILLIMAIFDSSFIIRSIADAFL